MTNHTFIQACAQGRSDHVEEMLRRGLDAATVVEGIDAMLVHQTHLLNEVFAQWGAGGANNGSTNGSITMLAAFQSRNLAAADFIMDYMVNSAQIAEHAWLWLFAPQWKHGSVHRQEVAVLVGQKTPSFWAMGLLGRAVEAVDAKLVAVVCSTLSDLHVAPMDRGEQGDLWFELLRCVDLIALCECRDDIEALQQRAEHQDILEVLLGYVDHIQLQQRLDWEIGQHPWMAERMVVLEQWVQNAQKQILEHTVSHSAAGARAARKI